MGLHLADARDGEDRPPLVPLRPPSGRPSVAEAMAAMCAVRPGQVADSGGSGPGLLGRRAIVIQGHRPGDGTMQDSSQEP